MQDISLNYTDDVKFPFNYKKIENTIGLQTKHIGSKHIAIEMGNLENQEADSLNSILEGTQKISNLTQMPFTHEELQKLQETYSTIISNGLQQNQFSKLQENGLTGYKLSINKEKFNTIAIQILETLKNDQNTLDKLNEYVKKQQNSAKITPSTIDNTIKSLQEENEESDVNGEIIVWVQKGKTTKLVIASKEKGAEIILTKKKEGDNLNYQVSLSVNDEENGLGNIGLLISANYAGLNEMQTVKESYSIQLQSQEKDQITVNYQLENQIDFTDHIEIEEFSKKNAMILNNYDKEKVNSFLQQVGNRIREVNKNQMEKLGLQENENPLLQMFNPILGATFLGQSSGSMNNLNFSTQEIESFNMKFENYVGTKLSGASVKGLLSTISLNNETAEENHEENQKIKEIHFDGEEYEVTNQNVAFIKDNVELETEYRVEVEKDENTGRIYRIVINKK